MKTEESGKLQNGESTKEGAAAAAATATAAAATATALVNVSEEKKKATKQRFMFNIADGGFTGVCVCVCVPVYKKKEYSLGCHTDVVPTSCLSLQSSTLSGRTRSGPPPSPRRPLRSGTVAMTTGCWRASYSILAEAM